MIGPFTHTSQLMLAAVVHEVIGKNLSAIRVLGVLIDAGGSRGTCYLNDETITGQLDISRATVWRATKALEEAGFLESDRRQAHRGRATTYVLPLDRPRVDADATPNSVAPNATLFPKCVARDATLSEPNSVAYDATQSSKSVALHEQKRCAERSKSVALTRNTNQDLNQKSNRGSRSRPRSAQDLGEGVRKRPPGLPMPADSATLEELVHHAVEHGQPVGQGVNRRMAKRLGLDPDTDGGLIAQHLWPVVKGEMTPDRLLEAARWADQALDPSRIASCSPLDGFLIKASGHPLPWPVIRGSNAARERENSRRPSAARRVSPAELRRQERAAAWMQKAAEAAAREAANSQESGNNAQDTRQVAQDAPGTPREAEVDPGIIQPPRRATDDSPSLARSESNAGPVSTRCDFDMNYTSSCNNKLLAYYGNTEHGHTVPAREFNKDTPESARAKLEEFKRRRQAATAC